MHHVHLVCLVGRANPLSEISVVLHRNIQARSICSVTKAVEIIHRKQSHSYYRLTINRLTYQIISVILKRIVINFIFF